MTVDEFDSSSMVSRKRKSTVSQDPSSPVVVVSDDSGATTSVTDAVLHGEVVAAVAESSMRARHRAAAASHSTGAGSALVLPLPVVTAAVTVVPTDSSPQREAKRPRVDQRRHKHHQHLLQAPPQSHQPFPVQGVCPQLQQRSRQAWRKRRANSLPNIHLRTPQYSHCGNSYTQGGLSSRLPVPNASRYPRATTPSVLPPARSGTSSPIAHPHCRYSLSATQIPLEPLINRETLKELDLEAILRNPQLRHDLLFDPGLQFQPTMSRRKRDVISKYWFALQRELECGCTCTAFNDQGKVMDCICTTPPSPLSPNPTRATAAHLLPTNNPFAPFCAPSRINRLITELLEVLLSVISPSTAPPPPHQSSSNLIPTTIFHHPSYTSQEAQLRAALDPRLIQQELAHGIFDPSGLFQLLGAILKCHCAPMRDRAVDTMVSIAQNCAPGKGGSMEDAVKAIRLCFEILELMKLDIANHQLLALRPYLVTTSSEFELRTFQERYGHGLTSLNLTRIWLQKALDTNPSLVLAPILTPSPTSTPTVRGSSLSHIHLAVLHALTDSVFSPCNNADSSSTGNYPETFYLDQIRLTSLSHEASDILALYMLLMLYRQLCCAAKRRPNSDSDLETVKQEIREIGPARLGRCFAVFNSDSTNRTKPSASSSKSKSTSTSTKRGGSTADEWNARIADVLLQLAARATTITDLRATSIPREQLPGKQTLTLLDGWTASNLKPNSPLSELLRVRLKSALFEIVVRVVLAMDPTSTSTSATAVAQASVPAPNGAGLEVLTGELRTLGEKVANLAICHWRVYGALYETKGFLSGS